MRSEDNRINVRTHGLITACLFLAMTVAGPDKANARSLYAIGSVTYGGYPLPILIYDIGADGSLTFQTEQTVPHLGSGAVGLALDWESGYLFVTYEGSDTIQLMDARTMAPIGSVDTRGAENLAGAVYDETKDLLYSVDMGSDKLFVHMWSPSTGKLTTKLESPFTLQGAVTHGIDLDETNGLLYVTSGNEEIRVYSTSDWSFRRIIRIARPAMAIAVDFPNQLIYTGAAYLGDYHLNQYDMNTGQNRSVQVDSEAGVVGLAVDLSSSLVYATTGRRNLEGGDDLLCYDSALTLIDAVRDIGDPAGIVIPARDIGYNPLRFVKSIVTDAEADEWEQNYVEPGEIVTYRLCFENLNVVREVSIVDTLPLELTFESADRNGDQGQYDAETHTYSWLIPSAAAGSQTCLDLRARVNPEVPVGTRVRNRATIRTGVIPPTSVSVEALVRGSDRKPLRVSKHVIGGVVRTDDIAYANAGDTISYAISYSNESNDSPVTKVAIVDTLPRQLTFVGAESPSGTAAYDPVNHTYTCSFVSLAAGATGRITLTARIQDDVPSGTILRNSVVATSEKTEPTTATADVTIRQTELQPLILTKLITSGGTDAKGDGVRYVNVGDRVTYTICCENRDNPVAVENISIVDFLPAQMAFVSADGDGQFGRYDETTHTYVWTIASVAPGESLCLNLVVQVKEDTPAGAEIVNRATVDSDQTSATSDEIEVIVNPVDPTSLNIVKRISDGATTGDDGKTQYVGIGTEITYQICFDSYGRDRRVEDVSIVDILPPEITFVSADGDGVYGAYDRDRHTYTWCYPSILPESEACVEMIVLVREETDPGTVIENHVTIDSDDTDPQTAGVIALAVQAKPKPLELTKAITGGARLDDRGGVYVAAGDEITYTVCVRNDNRQAARNVTVVDTLPDEVTFVSAAGDGVFGSYNRTDHTYTWRYATIEPGERVCADVTVRIRDDVRPGSTITNRVQAKSDETTSAVTDTEVVVESEPPLRVAVSFSPLILGRTGYNRSDQITALLEFPADVKQNDVSAERVTLDPGGITANSQTVSVVKGKVQIRATFDLIQVLDAIPDNGITTLYIRGKLQSQLPFVAEGTVLVVAERPY